NRTKQKRPAETAGPFIHSIFRLKMYCLPVCHFNRILHALTDGGVWVDAVEDLVMRGFELAGHNCFNDDLCYIVTDHVCAQPFPVFRIKDHFYKTFGMACSG